MSYEDIFLSVALLGVQAFLLVNMDLTWFSLCGLLDAGGSVLNRPCSEDQGRRVELVKIRWSG